MAGRNKGRILSPGNRELRAALDKVLKAAAGFDRIERGSGDRVRSEAALALRAVVQRNLGTPPPR